MEDILKIFEKALAEHHQALGKRDNLVAAGEMILQEFRKLREANVTLGLLLADFYAQEQPDRLPPSDQTKRTAYEHRALLWNNITPKT